MPRIIIATTPTPHRVIRVAPLQASPFYYLFCFLLPLLELTPTTDNPADDGVLDASSPRRARESDLRNLRTFSTNIDPETYAGRIVCERMVPAVLISKMRLTLSLRASFRVEPVLYRTIAVSSLRHTTDDYLVLPQQFLLRTMRTKPPKFFHNNVRHLFLGACPTGIVSSVLTVCTHVENLSIDINLGADDIRLIASFPLQHLYTVFEPFLRALPPTHGLFSQLTHLDIVDKPDPLPSPDAMGRWVTLSLMPRLTHLSFRNHRFIRICGRLLETCESLSVLVSMSTSGIEHADRPILNDLERYPRFVVLRCNDFFDDWNFGIRLGLLGASGKGHRETSTGGNQLNCSVHSTSIP